VPSGHDVTDLLNWANVMVEAAGPLSPVEVPEDAAGAAAGAGAGFGFEPVLQTPVAQPAGRSQYRPEQQGF